MLANIMYLPEWELKSAMARFHSYDRTANAPRVLAETHFDSDIVLSEFVQSINVSP
jgi:hypothetical protein